MSVGTARTRAQPMADVDTFSTLQKQTHGYVCSTNEFPFYKAQTLGVFLWFVARLL
jgi:hypothetical protein